MVIDFPKIVNQYNDEFTQFVVDNKDDPELPLAAYRYLCAKLDMPEYDMYALSEETYLKIEGAVNGLLDRARFDGIITVAWFLQNRRCQRG